MASATRVGNLVIDLAADVAHLRTDMTAAGKVVGDAAGGMSKDLLAIKTSLEAALNPLQALTLKVGSLDSVAKQATQSVTGLAKGLLLGAAAGITFDSLRTKIMSTVQSMADLKTLSEKTGSSVESLSKLGGIARQSGSDIDSVAAALGKMSKGMAGADNDTKGAGAALSFLGISAKDAAGNLKDPAVIFTEVAKKLNTYEDGAGKAAIAQALFGKAGADMLPTMKLLAESGDMAAKVTDAQATAARQYTRDVMKLDAQKNELFKTLSIALLPTMSDFTNVLLSASKNTNVLNGEAKNLANDNSIGDWADSAAMGVARLIDVIKTLPAMFSAVAHSGSVVLADIGLVGKSALMLNPVSMAKSIAQGDNPFDSIKALTDQRNKTLAEANAAYEKLWDSAGNATEKAMQARITARKAEQDFMANADAKDLRARAQSSGVGSKQKLNYNTAKEDGGTGGAKSSDYDRLIKSISEKTALLNLDMETQGKLTDGQKLATKIMDDLRTGTLKLTDAQKINLTGHLEAMLVTEKANIEQDKAAKATMAQLEAHQKYIAGVADGTDKINEQTVKQREATAELGLSKEAVQALRAAELERQAAVLEGRAIYDLDRQGSETDYNIKMREVAALRELAVAKREFVVKEVAVEAAQAADAEWKKTTDSIYQGLTDSLYRGFESGKGFFKSFWDGIKNLFKTTVLKLAVQGVMTGVTGVLGLAGSAANASTGASALGTVGNIGSIASGAGTIAGLGSAMTGAFSAGAAIGTEAFGAGVTMMANATGASSFLAGGAQALGALGPAGWIALAALAAFAIFSGNGGVPTSSTGDSQIRFDAAGNETSRLDLATASYTARASTGADAIVKSLQTGYAGLAASLGVATTASAFAYSGNTGEGGEKPNFALSGGAGSGYYNSGDVSANDANMQQEVARLMLVSLQGSDLPKYLKGAFDGMAVGTLTQAQIAGVLTSAQALKGFHDQLQALPFDSLKDLSFGATQAMIGMAGGLDNLKTMLGGFMDNFYSDAEKAALSQKNIAAALSSVGLQYTAGDIAKMTRAQYRAIYESQAKAFGADNPTALMLLKLSASFAALTPAAQAAANAVDGLAASQKDMLQAMDTARGNLIGAYKNEAAALQTTLGKFKDFSAGIKAFKESLTQGSLSTLTPAQKYAEAQGQFQKTSALAKTGNEAALGQIQGVAQSFLQASQTYNASGAQYLSDFAQVSDALDSASTGALAAADVAQLQLSALDAQLGWLTTINNSVLSVADALAQYKSAQVSLAGVDPIEGLYVGLLGRASDAAGKAGFTAAMNAGMSVASIAQAMKDSPEYAAIHGSHALGLASVPFDGYRAELHKGERVLTAQDNAIFSRMDFGRGNGNSDALVAEIKALRAEVSALREQNNAGHVMNVQATDRNANQVASSARDAASSMRYGDKLALKAAIV